MMMTKSLIFGSAVGLVAMGGAQAADLPVKAKAVEYVRICSLYGAAFYYIPGTDTCIKFGGYLRVDLALNSPDYVPGLNGQVGAQNRLSNYYNTRSRSDFTIDTRTATEYGVVRTYSDVLFTWTTGNYVGSAPGAYDASGVNVGSTTLGINYAFIQFAGFTMGRAVSAFDAPWQSYPAGLLDGLPGGSNHVTGANQFTYTAQFGNGVSGSLSAEDPTAQNTTNAWNTSYATALLYPTGAYGTNSFGGTRAPDLIGNVTVDQAWGLFKLSAAAHNNHVSYYGTTEPTGHPGDKWGFAVQAALSIKKIPTGPGDTLNVQAVYTDSASRYNFQTFVPTTYALYGGSNIPGAYQSLGLGSVADVTYSGTTAATGTALESVKTWGFRGGFTHNWNANWASAIYGAYASVRYGNNAKNAICSPAVATSIVVLNGLTGNCNPDLNIAVIGTNLIWTPVKNLAFTADINVTQLDQKYSGVIAAPAVLGVAKPAAFYTLKDQTGVSMLIRAQRNL